VQQTAARSLTTTIVLMGVSGSGKSTVMDALAQRLGWVAAEGDDFHPAANIAKMRAGHPLTDEDRWPWLLAIAGWIAEQEAAGHDALVTCSVLKRAYRDLLRRGHPSVCFVHLVAPVDVLAERVARRTQHYLPASLLASQLDTLEPLAADEPGAAISAAGTQRATVAAVLAWLAARGEP